MHPPRLCNSSSCPREGAHRHSHHGDVYGIPKNSSNTACNETCNNFLEQRKTPITSIYGRIVPLILENLIRARSGGKIQTFLENSSRHACEGSMEAFCLNEVNGDGEWIGVKGSGTRSDGERSRLARFQQLHSQLHDRGGGESRGGCMLAKREKSLKRACEGRSHWEGAIGGEGEAVEGPDCASYNCRHGGCRGTSRPPAFGRRSIKMTPCAAAAAAAAAALLLLLSISAAAAAATQQHSSADLSTYIFLTSLPHIPRPFASPHHWYASAVSSATRLPLPESLHLHGPFYTYHRALHGFAARLSPLHVRRLLRSYPAAFLHSFRDDQPLRLHTTHTPHFLHLPDFFPASGSSLAGSDVVVGVIDTGIWPERPSFNDSGLSRPPSRWNGHCDSGDRFNASLCNRKLIGARAFFKGYESAYGPIDTSAEFKSARDSEGHGSHTASTAAGSFVAGASLFGAYAPGDARGMAPASRLSVYKVCWEPGCFNADILAAFDAAVADGVDIISLSVGGSIVPFYEDSIALGSFGAVREGILVSCSAGNSGPYAGSVTNVPPWVVTVAASTVDRTFPAPVTLGDGSTYDGASAYSGLSYWEEGDQIPVVYAGDAAANSSAKAKLCVSGSLDPDLVQGKIVMCERGTNARVAKGLVVKETGGVGMILANTAESGAELIADSHLLPATLVSFKDGNSIKAYIAAAGGNATATIAFKGTELEVAPAPMMAAFSSRGPNPQPPEILKPDLTAPGVNILAAYTGATGPTGLDGDDRIVDFNLMSGTSMSCPHVSGLAAVIKAAHPSWSPAAIKSALMTTASVVDNTGSQLTDLADSAPSSPFAYGAGHVDPAAALDPGLVYDLGVQGYVDFLCSMGYRGADLQIFTRGEYGCSATNLTYGDLNYPTFAHVFELTETGEDLTAVFTRAVTNVGNESEARYEAVVDAPGGGVEIAVEPEVLEFDADHMTVSYALKMKLRQSEGVEAGHWFGSITWKDGVHAVRSVIAITVRATGHLRQSI